MAGRGEGSRLLRAGRRTTAAGTGCRRPLPGLPGGLPMSRRGPPLSESPPPAAAVADLAAGGGFPPPAPAAAPEAGPAWAGGGEPDAGPGPARLVVFSGGTAFNSVAGELQHYTTRVAHVLPVSDDGGSTAEIVRVLGGPAVGDIRSRCLRLADASAPETRAVNRLLGHRLDQRDSAAAQQEWYAIVEGGHPIWRGISDPYKNTIRAFLVHFHTQILRHATERFDFSNGSIGNFFFAGARVFFRSLEAAIFLFSRVARIPEGSYVLPAICTEERLTLGAELADGATIRGQNQISHPPREASSAGGATSFDKDTAESLGAPIKRVFYLSSEGTHREHEVYPRVNPRVLETIGECEAVVYGMGSLYTSLCPSLVLGGVGEAVAARAVPKVLIVNAWNDRESEGYTAATFAEAVVDSLNRAYSDPSVEEVDTSGRRSPLRHAAGDYITTVVVPKGGSVYAGAADHRALLEMGVRSVVEVDTEPYKGGKVAYKPAALVEALRRIVGEGREEGGNGAA